MIRKFAYNKIFRTSGMLFLFLFLLLFPVSKEYSLKDNITKNTIMTTKKSYIYLIDKNGYVARSEVQLSSSDTKTYIENILKLLVIGGSLEDKLPNGFKAILPIDTKILDIILKDDFASIDFSSEFLELNEVDFNKAISAITYNLTSLDKIKKVYIKVNGKLLNSMPKFKKIINQPFSRKDGINKVYDFDSYKNVTGVTVYYLNKNNNYFYYVPVTRMVNDDREKIKIIIDELTSSNIYETNLMSFLNYNAKLLDYKFENEKLILNFNNYLLDDENSMKVLEEVIYSISFSIQDNYDVKEVVFNVNGKEITKSVLKNIE